MRRLVTLLLDLEIKFVENLSIEAKKALLLKRLRTFPYWRNGHRKVFEISLLTKDLHLAYGAAQAVFALAVEAQEKDESRHLIARALLAGAQADRALRILDQISPGYKSLPQVQEDISACLMALGKDEEAQNILLRLGHQKLSPEGRAVLAYLEKKLSNKLYS